MKDKLLKSFLFVLPICLIVLVYLLLMKNGISCPIKYIFGISCPGCGMTRAWISAPSWDFAQAFRFHPLWFTVPAFFVFGIVSYKRKCYKALQIDLAIFVGVFLITYLLRLLIGSDVVVFDPSEGLIF